MMKQLRFFMFNLENGGDTRLGLCGKGLFAESSLLRLWSYLAQKTHAEYFTFKAAIYCEVKYFNIAFALMSQYFRVTQISLGTGYKL